MGHYVLLLYVRSGDVLGPLTCKANMFPTELSPQSSRFCRGKYTVKNRKTEDCTQSWVTQLSSWWELGETGEWESQFLCILTSSSYGQAF